MKLSYHLLTICLLLSACSKAPLPVLDLKIADGDSADYNRSLTQISDRQTPEERLEFAKCLQELKYQAMLADGVAPGPEMNAALRQQIAGLTVRDVLVFGHTISLGRKQEQEKALVRSIVKNKRLRTKPGDEASATFLASTHANQGKQLVELRAQISAIVNRINQLLPGRIPPGLPPAPVETLESIVPADELDETPAIKKTDPSDRRKNA